MAEVSADDASRLSMAAAAGRDFPSRVDDNSVTRTMFADMIEEIAKIPGDAVVTPISDFEYEAYDALIDASMAPGWETIDKPRSADEIARARDEAAASVQMVKQMSLVTKADNERRFTLGPMYVPNQLDAHNEWTDPDELQTALWDYVKSGDRRIRLQHNRDVVAGEWVEAMAIPFPVSVPMQKADGQQTTVDFPENTVFMGVIWEPWAWDLVKSGKLRGYSIGGKAERVLVDLEN